MSKSKGNTLDPLDLIDGITLEALLAKSTTGLLRAEHKEKAYKYVRQHFPQGIPAFGVDALRFTFASLASFARTLNFDLGRCEGYRNFCNKLWNASRFVLMNCEGRDTGVDETLPAELSVADRWIVSRLQRAEQAVREAFRDYRFDLAGAEIYELTWDEYCDCMRGDSQGGSLARRLRGRSAAPAARLTRVPRRSCSSRTSDSLHHGGALAENCPARRQERRSIMIQPYPQPQPEKIDEAAESRMATLKDPRERLPHCVSDMGIAPGQRLPASCRATASTSPFRALARGAARLSECHHGARAAARRRAGFVVGGYKLMLKVDIDPAAEREAPRRKRRRGSGGSGKGEAKLANPGFSPARRRSSWAEEKERLALRGNACTGRRTAAQARMIHALRAHPDDPTP
jgi:valyl-tRNA synthetase